MGIFKRRRDAGEERTLDGLSIPAGLLSDGRSVTPESAMRIADVYACVRCLADAAASVPLHTYRRVSGGRERVTTGRTVELLERPAPAVSQANLVSTAVAHLVTRGNCFLGKFRGADGKVEQLALLHPERVQVEILRGEPRYTLTGPTGERSVHGREDVLHIRGLSTDGVLGLSPITVCATAMRVAQGAGAFVDGYLARGARPSGILKVPSKNDDAVQRLSAAFGQRHAGHENMHRVAVVGGEVEWIAITPTLGDLEFVEQRKLSTAEIARIFRVPPRLIGAPSGDSQTYANVESAQLEFVTHSLRPWLVVIEQAITNDPDLCRGPNVFVEFLLDALLRADSKTRAEVYALALDEERGWMNRAEIRRLENLPPDQEANDQ